MQYSLLFHVIGGGIGIVSGFVALAATKGIRLHRRAGTIFVWSMLAMSLSGAAISAWRHGTVSVIAGLLTAYLVTTALTTVRPRTTMTRRVDLGATIAALVLGPTSLALGFITAASPSGLRDGIPPFPLFMFGTIGLLAGLGDLRVMRLDGLRGGARLARHLWRMCWALWVACMSFFLGQSKHFPKEIRIPALLAMPGLIVLVAMLYWLWRVRGRRASRTAIAGGALEAGA